MTRAESGPRTSLCGFDYSTPGVPVSLDLGGVDLAAALAGEAGGRTAKALDALDILERGGLANADEQRMVGHYWLRDPIQAPTKEITSDIESTVEAIARFSSDVRAGAVAGPAGPFLEILHIGIGGSAVGPQFLCGTLPDSPTSPRVHFLDNSDPLGVERVLGRLRGGPDRTLVSIVSKSGYTPTPMAVARQVEQYFAAAGLDFAAQAVATTMHGSPLDEQARRAGWLHRFPLWDWVGGRTSVTSAVGLLPAALLGMDIAAFLDGAAAVDRWTRDPNPHHNPALALALAWYHLGAGRGAKNMVVLPYSDQLVGLPRWLQQLVMESLGKRSRRDGTTVEHGMTVYGNKGSSDQHAYMQQLKDGPADFFLNFVRVRYKPTSIDVEVEPGITLADHLFAGLEGTRASLEDRGRPTITTILDDVGPRSVGAVIALYERAVGLYAELVDVNAYHQPAVDKYAARPVLDLQLAIIETLASQNRALTTLEIAETTDWTSRCALVGRLLEHLATHGRVERVSRPGPSAATWRVPRDRRSQR